MFHPRSSSKRSALFRPTPEDGGGRLSRGKPAVLPAPAPALLTVQALTFLEEFSKEDCFYVHARGFSTLTAALEGLQVKQGEQMRSGKLVGLV